VNKQALCQLLPHSGTMCLIDKIVLWDKTSLLAQTESHLDSNNPLRHQGSISSIIGVEYAAQSMALHAALLSQQEDPGHSRKQKPEGYLATIRTIRIGADSLYSPDSANLSPLMISVSVLMCDSQGYSYEFTITADNSLLLSGRLTIFLTSST